MFGISEEKIDKSPEREKLKTKMDAIKKKAGAERIVRGDKYYDQYNALKQRYNLISSTEDEIDDGDSEEEKTYQAKQDKEDLEIDKANGGNGKETYQGFKWTDKDGKDVYSDIRVARDSSVATYKKKLDDAGIPYTFKGGNGQNIFRFKNPADVNAAAVIHYRNIPKY